MIKLESRQTNGFQSHSAWKDELEKEKKNKEGGEEKCDYEDASLHRLNKIEPWKQQISAQIRRFVARTKCTTEKCWSTKWRKINRKRYWSRNKSIKPPHQKLKASTKPTRPFAGVFSGCKIPLEDIKTLKVFKISIFMV